MFKRSAIPILAIVFAVLLNSGCLLGYQHQVVDQSFEGDGANLQVDGTFESFRMGIVMDFLFFRLIVPYDFVKRKLSLKDSDGGVAGVEVKKEQRIFRLEAPVLSIWTLDDGWNARYPGSMRKRKSLEFGVGAESDLLTSGMTWFADVGLTYYHYNRGAVHLFGGYGESPFLASTNGVGPQFPYTWKERVGGWGGGVAITIFAGEYALGFFEYILEEDAEHRKNYD